jgi:uncharacterized membrane protein
LNADTLRRMVTVSADAAAVMAQVVAAIVFASVLELRRGYAAQRIWELRILAGLLLVFGFALSGGILLELVTITARGGFEYEPGPPLEVWIAIRFLLPVAIFLLAELLRKGGLQLSGRDEEDPQPMEWGWKELRDAFNGRPHSTPSRVTEPPPS